MEIVLDVIPGHSEFAKKLAGREALYACHALGKKS